MAAAIDTIRDWFDEGVKAGAQYMLVVTDSFSYEDFPVYANEPAEVIAKHKQYTAAGTMTRVPEIYDLGKDKWAQLASVRAWALPDEPA